MNTTYFHSSIIMRMTKLGGTKSSMKIIPEENSKRKRRARMKDDVIPARCMRSFKSTFWSNNTVRHIPTWTTPGGETQIPRRTVVV